MTPSASAVVLRVADRVRRLVWRVAGPRTVGVRGLVVDGDDRVLLVRHSYGLRQWQLPGGGVKRRETILDALHRELREEAGILVGGTPVLHGTFSNMAEGKSDHVTVFVVTEWTVQASDSAEIDGQGFFAVGDLPAEVSRGTRRRIEEWCRGTIDPQARW